MPCSDISETIRVVLDHQDKLIEYTFSKQSCGQGIGTKDLLHKEFAGKTPEVILEMEPGALLDRYPETSEEVIHFLYLKHFFAIHSVMEVLIGRASGGKSQACVLAELSYDVNGLTIEADINIDLNTRKIKACGGCGTCGTKRPTTAA
jgi:hypothetical protein